jgi:hypothetical protein
MLRHLHVAAPSCRGTFMPHHLPCAAQAANDHILTQCPQSGKCEIALCARPLFAFDGKVRRFEEGKAALLAWDEFTVNVAGQLMVELAGVRNVWWVALGDVSGEVTVFRADKGVDAGRIHK